MHLSPEEKIKLQEQFLIWASSKASAFLSLDAVCRLYNEKEGYEIYLFAQEITNPNVVWALTQGNNIEVRSILLSETFGFVLDKQFKHILISDLYSILIKKYQ